MACEYKVTRRVEFAETDMAGLVHYSNYFRYMDATEHAFYRALGFSAGEAGAGEPVNWPRVHAQCHFKKPLRFEDEVEIHLLVTRKRSKAIHYEFRFRKLNAMPPEEVARGCLTIVCAGRRPDGSMYARPMPEEFASKIEAAPKELLI